MKLWKKMLLTMVLVTSAEAEVSSQIQFENRFFFDNYQSNHLFSSISVETEYLKSSNEDRNLFTIKPFYRYDQKDSSRTHFDLREFSLTTANDKMQWRIGRSKVFWGVNESIHLVDVINQTDSLENIDGEDKLGQWMLSPTWYLPKGSVEVFLLPRFEERSFVSTKGRFSGGLNIDDENSMFEKDENHLDYALRWNHQLGDSEMALSFFDGTSRTPDMIISNSGRLTPFYRQAKQVGLEFNTILDNWSWKLESIYKSFDQSINYFATVFGFEYTYYNYDSNGKDLGILLEYLYDSRGNSTVGAMDNLVFVGSRLSFNDVEDSSILGGVLYDISNDNIASFRLEASKRIQDNLKLELEANFFLSTSHVATFNSLRNDDYVELSISYYF
ncbi:MAG: hypothetical protein KC646_11735 [Candidatus Cloacimonetes bacterium]|nr:hypothetical protein [Candidatus Cloacimonadota bacterium]